MTPLLEARGLVRRYRRGGEDVTPLDGVDLDLRRGEIVGIAGPSGVGKSTLARCLCLDEEPDEGTVRVEGVDPRELAGTERRRLRRRVQLVVQDPSRALHPRWTVGRVVSEPLVALPRGERPDAEARRRKVAELLEQVGLPISPDRRADELSGGQTQRLVVARALACDPLVLALDESLTGLDLSLQARTVNLLRDLLEDDSVAVCAHVVISHDRELLGAAADRVLELRGGRLGEEG